MLSNIILKRTIVILIFIIVLSIFYFSWIPDPYFVHIGFLPKVIGVWSDQYINVRTAVPFFCLGILEGIIVKKSMLFCFIFFIVIVFICEFGQLFMPERHFDPLDIFWGVFGGMMGLILVKGLSLFFSKFKNNY